MFCQKEKIVIREKLDKLVGIPDFEDALDEINETAEENGYATKESGSVEEAYKAMEEYLEANNIDDETIDHFMKTLDELKPYYEIFDMAAQVYSDVRCNHTLRDMISLQEGAENEVLH